MKEQFQANKGARGIPHPDLNMENPAESNRIIVYGRPGCPGIFPVRKLLEASGIEYEYIDIFYNDEARARVQAINRGYESVPTLVFPDGASLTEPGPGRLIKKLADLGYDIEPALARRFFLLGMLTNPVVLIILVALIYAVLALFDFL